MALVKVYPKYEDEVIYMYAADVIPRQGDLICIPGRNIAGLCTACIHVVGATELEYVAVRVDNAVPEGVIIE